MTLYEIGQAATTAESACTIVIDHPDDLAARQTLVDVLTPIVNPMFDDHDELPIHLHGLIRQACSFGEIVQARIDAAPNEPHLQSSSTASIQSAARDLQRVLRGILDSLATGRNA